MAINASTYLIWIDTITPTSASKGTLANYRPVVCGTGNSFNSSVSEIDVSNKCDGGWRQTRPGYGSWGLDVDGFAVGLKTADKLAKANFQELLELQFGKRLFWACMCDIDRNIYREGVVWISSFDESANNNEAYSFSASMVGVGRPIIGTDFFKTLLATNQSGNIVIEDGTNKAILVPGGTGVGFSLVTPNNVTNTSTLTPYRIMNSFPQFGQPESYRFSSGIKPDDLPDDVIFLAE